MRSSRALWIVVALAGCAKTVSEPNPPRLPRELGPPYAGRIVLGTPALRTEVSEFDHSWLRRLALLGLTARIIYDDARAVIDVYGAADLPRLAGVLADPGGWQLSGYPFDGVATWLPGRARVAIDSTVLCQVLNARTFELSRPGAGVQLGGKVRVVARNTMNNDVVEVKHPQFQGKCPEPGMWPDSVLLDLPGGAEDATWIVLALGGGNLPHAPQIVAVEPAGGRR